MTTATARMTEAEWQKQVTDLAELYGWVWAHFRPAKTSRGWRTPVAGPGGAGFPDLVMWRDRLILVELKRDGGRQTEAQRWVERTMLAAGAEFYVFRPGLFDVVHDVLRERRRAA